MAATIESNKRSLLLKAKKLILVLDLDLTLLHTVQGVSQDPDVLNFEIEGNNFTTKLRPYLSTFLEKLSPLYEMCVYTMGSHAYAQQIAHIIDPGQKYFGNRVLSK
jgi:TFIIF-interacting CTD phosphatase-like protein